MSELVRRGHLPVLSLDDGFDEDDSYAPNALAHDLARAVRGEVRFDRATRAMYATDASNYRHVPIGVVRPRDADDIAAAVAVCRSHDVPVLARGGGTSLAGQCCNVAVVLDSTKYMRGVLSIDAGARLAVVEPGCILDDLNRDLVPHDLCFGPDPATHAHCSLGGMIGNNSCGAHSVMAGRTADNVRSLEVLTWDGQRFTVGPASEDDIEEIVAAGGRRGEIYAGLRDIRDRYAPLIRARYPRIPRRVSGYNLDELLPENGFHVARALVGSEGTCVTVLSATLELVHRHRWRALAVLGYPDIYEAADRIEEILASGPIACEGLDRKLVEHARQKRLHVDALGELPQGDGWLIVEFGGDTSDEARALGEDLLRRVRAGRHPPHTALYLDHEAQQKVWEVRESGLGATARAPHEADTWPGWEDSAVPPEKMGLYLRDFRRLLQSYGYDAALYGHFGHGCLHCRIDFRLHTEEGVAAYRAFVDDAAELVSRYGGSYSGEHGDGQSRAELLPKMFGPELVDAMRQFKELWDPRWRMNPGRVVDPLPITSDLRLGPSYRPWEPRTSFAYPADDGKFARAMTRCVGIGQCRNEESATMCPSWRATHEEMHSTRGRAHLLFEMLNRDLVNGGWQDEGVKEALDLCLACKGCKHDCPVNVDMATYKAEFLSRYYKGHSRPRESWAFGYIDVWARLAEVSPRLVNAFTSAPGLRSVAKWLAHVHPARDIPRFAPRTFRRRFVEEEHRRRRDGERLVLLWPDTFNDHFYPGTLAAAAEVLEAAGFVVDIPRERLCCGRPVYDFGLVDRGRALLRRSLFSLAPYIDARVPIVFLEPSCLSVFTDELRELFPDDPRATALSQLCQTLPAFLDENAPDDFLREKLAGPAVLHGHCHQKALLGMEHDREMLARTGLSVELLDSGCCGMAGSFGFERDKYEVAQAVADGDLFAKLRAHGDDVLVVTDGFSCREQVRMGLARTPLHTAEVFHAALHAGERKPAPARLEPGREPAVVRTRSPSETEAAEHE